MESSSPVFLSMKGREKGRREPRPIVSHAFLNSTGRVMGRGVPWLRIVGIVRVDEKYASVNRSNTANFVERARPEENAILARTVESSGDSMSARLVSVNAEGSPEVGVGVEECSDARRDSNFVPRIIVSPIIADRSFVVSTIYSRSSVSICRLPECEFTAAGGRTRSTKRRTIRSGTFHATTVPEGNMKRSPCS